jgi:subtilase family serine protease
MGIVIFRILLLSVFVSYKPTACNLHPPPRRFITLKKFVTTVCVLAVLSFMLLGTVGQASAHTLSSIKPHPVQACSFVLRSGYARCMSIVMVGSQFQPNTGPAGYHPADLQSAYKLPSSSAGSGQTVAIVDAFDDPNAEANLGVYRSTFGLSPCTTANGCFKKVDENGGTHYPSPNVNWAEEISLDLDMVSAVCPKCHILLVEATTNSFNNLGTSVNRAATMGANAISNSYGGSEFSSEGSLQTSFYTHPGVAITASSGDNGYGTQVPAAFNTLTAVGGTSLKHAANTRGWKETVWSGAGSGCSAFITKPSWQKDPNCSRRTIADTSAVADPNTGVSVYDTYQQSGWLVFGGTSVSSPVIASVFALAGNASSINTSHLYSHTTGFYDVKSGSNGSCGGSYLCTGVTGYDGPTGLGTPKSTSAF